MHWALRLLELRLGKWYPKPPRSPKRHCMIMWCVLLIKNRILFLILHVVIALSAYYVPFPFHMYVMFYSEMLLSIICSVYWLSVFVLWFSINERIKVNTVPCLSGALYDAKESYDLPFFVAGSLLAVSSCILLLERPLRRCKERYQGLESHETEAQNESVVWYIGACCGDLIFKDFPP